MLGARGFHSSPRIINFPFPLAELDLVLGARGFHVSNPPVLPSILLKASLDVFAQTSMPQLCRKSRILTGYLEMLIEQNLVREAVQEKADKNDVNGGK